MGRKANEETFALTFISSLKEDNCKVIYRTKEEDKTFVFPFKKNHKKLIKEIDGSILNGNYQIYKLSKPKLIQELNTIEDVGSQDMKLVSTFKFGILYYKPSQNEEQMFSNCLLFLFNFIFFK